MLAYLCSVSLVSLLYIFVVVSPGFRSLFFFNFSQQIGWEQRLRNDLFCVEWDVKP